MDGTGQRWTEPTTGYWQTLLPDWPGGRPPTPPYRFGYPVRLPDGRVLVLPIRPLPDGTHAVASLIANQASFAVVRALAGFMARAADEAGAETIVGLPTLGLAFAPLVAEDLGHARYVPLGYSRKFWYEDRLSEPVASITSPGGGKRIFVDPNQLDLLRGRRIVVVDDAVSSGTTAAAVARLFGRLGLDVAAIVVAMRQTQRWRAPLAAVDPALPDRVRGVFDCPRLAATAEGWVPVEDSEA
ncbi:phosphoribosyltransferase [Methylobacterium oryzihabitans]|uniref:Phosphoribosyltransferase n=1 Tax=Methylobacterium oryzihabitans TaxID=2499852 RepID=A0A3S3U2V7_9HYPH|nr:phosphoribosyltransferase [Methylobacterium oryzihabitans]RVU14250.1 phosphoribosyltransferase [Methylobacterium oryzihabitans]